MEDWRRIDIDALDPEAQIIAEELKPEVAPVSAEEVQTRISTLRSYISKGAFTDAIGFLTEDPPYGADDASKVSVNH
ncbi:Actin-related protein 2/3 complex subunit 5 [Wickerhamomyces ciferrii]|uniref:Actin-related protein 2/3 complex subunit 5 n=1 Tax=Wickerhamomyces ciferrii (strain ATCC 14091 / BCRC 22168 / CBS 111 / JCM 3599 / NBRC 0793 / NRRL Y-1031 F-60-10) TaxID=1206466 RepID=K0KSM8_WICCF|nr:Actin-related protein 2/3 complex subunit 5 [Wickerhamomyces ciferrii]CCH44354.1 Actin-related protein 2/3 complex subunit 5 [Wickerhamomyces ciferrii]